LTGATHPVNMTIDVLSGQVFWVPPQLSNCPTKNVSCLYALQIRIWDGPADSQGNLNFTAPTTGYTPLDFIMEIILPCNVSDPTCNLPPRFVPPLPFNKTFFVSVEGSYLIQAVDDNVQDTVTVSYSPLPTGSSFDPITAPGNPCVYKFRWTPRQDQTAAVVCYQATDSRGMKNLGNYCIRMFIGKASLIYISGVIRDFHRTTPILPNQTGISRRVLLTLFLKVLALTPSLCGEQAR